MGYTIRFSADSPNPLGNARKPKNENCSVWSFRRNAMTSPWWRLWLPRRPRFHRCKWHLKWRKSERKNNSWGSTCIICLIYCSFETSSKRCSNSNCFQNTLSKFKQYLHILAMHIPRLPYDMNFNWEKQAENRTNWATICLCFMGDMPMLENKVLIYLVESWLFDELQFTHKNFLHTSFQKK